MLDVSIRISVLAMLGRLRDDLGVGFLFITHDLAIAKYFGWNGKTAVMYLGRIVEFGPTRQIINAPTSLHPGADRRDPGTRSGPDQDQGRRIAAQPGDPEPGAPATGARSIRAARCSRAACVTARCPSWSTYVLVSRPRAMWWRATAPTSSGRMSRWLMPPEIGRVAIGWAAFLVLASVVLSSR